MANVANWQLDAMYGAESARLWEMQNQGFNPYPAAYKLSDALSALHKADSLIGSAAEKAEGQPEEEKIMSLLYDMEQIENAIAGIIHDDLGVNLTC